METKINLTAEAAKVLEALRHSCGTYQYYTSTLSRVTSMVLHYYDEMGMSSREALGMVAAIDDLQNDLRVLAATAREPEITEECDSTPVNDDTDTQK